MTPAWYFAYGSNMNPARVASRGLPFDAVCGGVLDGVRLTFDKQSRDHAGSGHANLTVARSGRVEGVLYRLKATQDIAIMDRFERVPINYRRDVVTVSVDGDSIAAWTYFANPAVIRSSLRPERAYLAHLLAGRPYLSEAYYAWLSATACIDD
jgi:cation transport regulator ChaC